MRLYLDSVIDTMYTGNQTSTKVNLASARLQSGSMSTASPIYGERRGIDPFMSALNKAPTQSPREGDIFEESMGPDRSMAEENTVLERPVWQSFVVMLMCHFPQFGGEIQPAMDIGALPPKRIVLSQEGLSFLNQFVHMWYQGGVEVVTIEELNPEVYWMEPTQEALYSVPFRPVTGLNVIVTPTIQRSMVARDGVILREKEKFGADKGLNGIGRFMRLCVFEDIIPARHPRRGEAKDKDRRKEGGWFKKRRSGETGVWGRRGPIETFKG